MTGFSHSFVRTAARLDDMGYNRISLRLEIQADGDVAVYIDRDGSPIVDSEGKFVRVEFCSLSSGGGRSKHTLKALFGLFEAMRLDAKERPDAIPEYPPGLAEMMAQD